MKRTVKKLFWAWQFDDEEKWLNEMSAKGLQLSSVGFCKYVFSEGLPGEYIYRLELLKEWPTASGSAEYIRFIEDTGAEHVGSLMRWVYFRKKADRGGFDMFSDVDSRIGHLYRILALTGSLFILNLMSGANQLFQLYQLRQLSQLALSEMSLSLFAGILCLSVGALLVYGSLRVFAKIRHLKKEKILHE